MVLIKNYITFQVLVLYTFKLLSADDKAHTVVRKEAITPHIIDGPGKIIDVSETSKIKKDSDRSVNDLLYEIYKKFSNDVKSHSTDRKRNEEKKGVIIETDGANLQKKTADTLPSSKIAKKTIDSSHADTSLNKDQNQVKKEQQKLRLKDLEHTIDKLIDSISHVSKDGNYEEKDINQGIDDLSKFADLSQVNTRPNTEKKNTDFQSFDEFKERFYDTFTADNDKRQKIVFHGKKESEGGTPKVAYHGKDEPAQYHDVNNNDKRNIWAGIKKRDPIVPFKKASPQYQVKSRKDGKPVINGERLQQLANLYEELRGQTAADVKQRDASKTIPLPLYVTEYGNQEKQDSKLSAIFEKLKGVDAADATVTKPRNDKVQKLKNDLASLLDVVTSDSVISSSNVKDVVVTKNKNVLQSTEDTDHKKQILDIHKLKKDLMAFFDLFSKNDDVSKGNRKDTYASPYTMQKKRDNIPTAGSHGHEHAEREQLLSLITTLETELRKDGAASSRPSIQSKEKISKTSSDPFGSNVNNIASGGGEEKLKKQLLSVVVSLQNELSSQNGGDGGDGGLPPVTYPPIERKDSNHVNNRFDSDLDNIVSAPTTSNNEYTAEEFFEALKGFQLKPPASSKQTK